METYKQIVGDLVQAESIDDLNHICAKIDRAFDMDDISYEDHEQLCDLVAKVSGGDLVRPCVPVYGKE